MTCRVLKLVGCFFVFASLASPLLGQTTEADIRAQLKDKPLYLRGFWRSNKLRFDGDGKLLDSSELTTFTLAGFDYKSAHLEKDRLVLEGRRMGTEFDKGRPKRVSLGSLKIEIGVPANAVFAPALHAIFADGLPELVASLPAYWQDFGSCLTIASVVPEKADLVANCTRDFGRNATKSSAPPTDIPPPRVLKRVEAQFTEEAKQCYWGGTTMIGLIVSETGLPTHLTVLRPLGLGLDEEALLAAAQYKFEPVKRNGKPMRSEAYLEVNFHSR